MPEDKFKLSDLKPGKTVKTKDGAKGKLRGAFMSTTGLMLRVKTNPNSISDRSVKIQDVDSID